MMMKPRIFLNDKQFMFKEDNLPIIIHGEEGFGATSYTLAVVTEYYLQGNKILFLCGYELAHQELAKLVDITDDKIILLTKEQVNEFVRLVPEFHDGIIVIKNIELFDESVFNLVATYTNIVISGDINKCSYKEKILNKNFNTKILFSELANYRIPKLEKYTAYFIANDTHGVTSLI